MNRIIVIGCPGSGKSTFARRLRDKLGLPLYYLDQIWHKPDKTNVSTDEFDERLNSIIKTDSWIIDGNYQRTIDVRLERCDTVFMFDLSTAECIAGVEARIGKKREDMPWIEEEFDSEFKEWIVNFPKNRLPDLYAKLELYRDKVEIHIFNSRSQADDYIKNLVN